MSLDPIKFKRIRVSRQIKSSNNPPPERIKRLVERLNINDPATDLETKIESLLKYAEDRNLSQVYISRLYSDLIRYNFIPYKYDIETYHLKHNTQSRSMKSEDADIFTSYIKNEALLFLKQNDKYEDYKYDLILIYSYLAIVYVLRINEMRQLTVESLKHLSMKENPKIILKGNKYWEPIYTSELIKRTNEVLNYFRDEPNDRLIFNMSTNGINYQLRALYRKIFKKDSPLGFGSHIFRYIIAKRAEKQSIFISNRFLNHTKLATTHKYLKKDPNEYAKTYEGVFDSFIKKL